MSKKLEQNLSKVRDMLTGNHKANIQVGFGDQERVRPRHIGEKWFDLEGVEWEQKKGYVSKVTSMPDVGIFSKNCKKCSRNCSRLNKDKRHFETWQRMGRCLYCQINFEADLKGEKIGINGNKWQFWVKLQMLQRWDSIDQEVQHLVFQNSDNKFNDKSIANALANEEVRKTRETIKTNSK
tara:strand:- start:41 stop:583 length:543 start_codon:yes stop_codon:yes gene_type:complete